MRTRLAVQPADAWVPARKNHATPAQLHALVAPAPDFATVKARFTRLYDLPPEAAAVTLSALEQYYLQRRDRQAHRQAATQALVDQLFEND
ncbi:hypothetical protein [Levilactobacillus spicheri]